MEIPKLMNDLTKIEYNGREVFFGAGIVMSRLVDILRERSLDNVLLVTSNSVARLGVYKDINKALNTKLDTVSRYENTRTDVPQSTVDELIELLNVINPDAVISIGGGSVIDSVKAAMSIGGVVASHIAIPTTLASAECTDIFGVIDDAGVKKVFDEYNNGPRIIIYDPEVTIETPSELWFGTALRVLDHAIERYYSTVSSQENDKMCLKAIEYIDKYLPMNINDNYSIKARLGLMYASFMSMSGSSMTCISHAIAHQIKSRGNNSMLDVVAVTQPEVIEFNGRYCIDKMRKLAGIFEGNVNEISDEKVIQSVVENVRNIISSVTDVVDIPTSLNNLGLDIDELPELADVLMKSPRLQYNPRPIISKEQMLELLQSMYN